MKEAILVIDFGTSNVRAVLFDAGNGDTLHSHSESYPILSPVPSYQELDPDTLWSSSVDCVRAVMKDFGPENRVRAIGFSFIGVSLFPLDAEMKPVYNCILCNDPRARAIAKEMIPLFQTDSWKFSDVAPASKIIWLRENVPDVYRKTKYFWTIQQYVQVKLGLSPAYDPSVANLHYFYDQSKGGWRGDIFSYADIPQESVILPVYPGEHILGEIERFGDVELNGPVPVSVGSQDGGLGMLGLGLLSEKDDVIAEVSGTFDHVGFFAAFDPEHPIPGRLKPGPLKDTVVRMYVYRTFGASVEWFMKTFCGSTAPEAYADLWANVRFDGTDSGISCNPNLSGQGSFGNLDLTVTRYDLFRALIESLTFEMRRSVEGVLVSKKNGCSRIRIGGGPTKEAAWAQLRADITGKAIERVVSTDNSALGAAVLASIGAGLYPDLPSASANLIRVKDRFEPNQAVHEAYEKRYQAYCEAVYREAE